MVVFLVGENEFLANQTIRQIAKDKSLNPESFLADDLTVDDLLSLTRGTSLFEDQRLIVLSGLFENNNLLDKALDWLQNSDLSNEFIIREESVDKRTKAYKTLTQFAKLIDAEPITERQLAKAYTWLRNYARELDIKLDDDMVQDICRRALVASRGPVRVVDQMMIHHALVGLAGTSEITMSDVSVVLPKSIQDNMFDLISIAVARKTDDLMKSIEELKALHDGFQLFGLIIRQWTQVFEIALTKNSSNLEINPFVRQNLAPLARNMSTDDLAPLTRSLLQLEIKTKNSALSPWDAVKVFLLEVALR